MGHHILTLLLSSVALARVEYYVSQSDGNDFNPGTSELPFKTIQKCSDAMHELMKSEESTAACLVRQGTYRESVQVNPTKLSHGRQLRTFQAASPDARVEVSGLDSLDGLQWEADATQKCVYHAKVPITVAAKKAFEIFDVDKSGGISAEEIVQILTKCVPPASPQSRL